MRAHRLHSGLALILLLTGCAQTASLTHWHPAEFDTGMHRLVVLDVDGTGDFRQAAQSALERGLGESCIYELVRERDLEAVAPDRLRQQDGAPNVPAVLEAARRMGADGVLATNVRLIERNGADFGSVGVRVGDPIVAAELRYALWHAWSGQLVAEDRVFSEFLQGDFSAADTDRKDQANVFRRLAAESGAALVRVLAPHPEPIRVVLRTKAWGAGAHDLAEGNAAAREGAWSAALRCWGSAVLANPESSAAWYNLGLAHEALGQFESACRAYERAFELDEQELYNAALARAEEGAAQSQLVEAQRARHLAWVAQQPSRH